jgi:hypothetical protein
MGVAPNPCHENPDPAVITAYIVSGAVPEEVSVTAFVAT